MSRIKGWKKSRDLLTGKSYYYKIENKKPSNVIIRHLWKNKYEVIILTPKSQRPISKVFKTKSQALRYAKLWMRRHPNG